MTIYRKVSARLLANFFTKHMEAMTAEKLHDKTEIAIELGYRDRRIVELEIELEYFKSRLIEAIGKATISSNNEHPEPIHVIKDPCPNCRQGVVCRTPMCGRLGLPLTHPCRKPL